VLTGSKLASFEAATIGREQLGSVRIVNPNRLAAGRAHENCVGRHLVDNSDE
jgi:hypothetical protein